MITARLYNVLELLAVQFKDNKISWILGGSSSLAIQGVKIRPKDVDILTDKRGAIKINKLLNKYCIRKVQYKHSNLFRSYFGEFSLDNVKVDVMGNLETKINGRWVSTLDRLKHPKLITFNKIKIPVTPLSNMLKIYELLGQKKDRLCIAKIKDAIISDTI